MKPLAAIVENEIDRIADELREAYEAARKYEAIEMNAIADANKRRQHLGRLLAEQRERWPERGPNAKGWGQLLDKVGIPQSTAWRYIEFYRRGSIHVNENPPRTYAEAGLDTRADVESPRVDDRDAPPPSDDDAPPDDGEVEIDRDTWCTPKWITEAIGHFDLDPCANERSHVQSTYSYQLERGEDGLKLLTKRWMDGASVRAFINPPYSDVRPWIEAYAHTRFCFLLKVDPSTKWFARLLELAEIVLVPRGTRIEFEPPPGVPPEKANANPFPHALFYARAEDATDEIRALCFPPWRIK